jgi:choline dehydrogenase
MLSTLGSYMKKAERFYPPSAKTQAQGAYFTPSAHGYHGDVGVSYIEPYNGWQFAEAVTSAAKDSFGLKGGDVASGHPNVVGLRCLRTTVAPSDMVLRQAAQIALSVRPVGNTSVRSSSSNSYLYPLFPAGQNKTLVHPGLTVLPGHQATRIVWGSKVRPVAAGVEYGAADATGARAVVRARKEVLVCAGAIATPAFLQRSGIGAHAALSALKIMPVVDLPSVGTNLQDQALVPLIWSLAMNVPSPQYQADVAFPSLAQLIGVTAAADASALLLRTARKRAAGIVAAGGHTSVTGLTKQFEVQAQQIAAGGKHILSILLPAES